MTKILIDEAAVKLAMKALESCSGAPHWSALQPALTALREALAEQPAQQEPVGPEPFGYFQYDIRLGAWVQNRINDKGVAFYTTGDISALKHRIYDQDLMLERQTARIVDLQTHIANLEGEE